MPSQFKLATAFLAQKFWLPPASPRPTFELMTTSLLQKFWLPPMPSQFLLATAFLAQKFWLPSAPRQFKLMTDIQVKAIVAHELL